MGGERVLTVYGDRCWRRQPGRGEARRVQRGWLDTEPGRCAAFDDLVAWLAVDTSKTAVVAVLRVAWATVGALVDRVVADDRAGSDPFDGLVRIGLDEI